MSGLRKAGSKSQVQGARVNLSRERDLRGSAGQPMRGGNIGGLAPG